MPKSTRLTGTLLLILLLAGLLHGCGSVVSRPSAGSVDELRQRAGALEASGNYQGAAQLYLSAARQPGAGEPQRLRLLAAGSLIRGGRHPQAAELLDSIAADRLAERDRQHYTLLQAAIALAEQRPDTVLELLQEVPDSGPFIADYRRLRARAWLQDSQYFRSAQERVRLDPLLDDPQAQATNRRAIWEAVNSLSDRELQGLRTAPPPDTLAGWMELVELTRLYLQQPGALAEVIPHWQRRYPGHPATGTFLDDLLATLRAAGQPPAQIAVLLPLNGKLSAAAAAIRDGIAAAYYDTPEGGLQPQVRFHDSGETAESAVNAYLDAVAGGAQFVIGPLRKEAVQALATLEPMPVPALALNRAGDPSRYNPALYQFGLAPEDEAREVARLAWRNGHNRAIALLPETGWGERVFGAFAAEWQSLGGTLVDTRRYDPARADHGEVIRAALNLDASKARHQKLTRLLGRKLQFEPHRRQDVDFVFLVASPRQARLIRPQLNFYRASDLPVYATSRVYTGQPDPRRDIDMNGIIFCDTPWTLEQRTGWEHLQRSIEELWPDTAVRHARLYALGLDAYRLVPYLGKLEQGMFGAYHGATGNLSVGEHGRIKRSLRCATFRKGLPVLLDSTTEDTLAGAAATH